MKNFKNQVLITKSNVCCPQCVSQISDNCEYYGRIYYNGEMWYNNGCQHCACDYGKVICMNVQCESTFCFKDEIMVKKKDDCCIECRKPLYCDVGNGLKIKVRFEFLHDFFSNYRIYLLALASAFLLAGKRILASSWFGI